MDTHVKVLGILNIVGGVMGICGALVLMLAFAVPAAAIVADADPDAAIALPILGITGGALVFFDLLVSIPAIVVGLGLFRMRPWARVWGIVLAILSLVVIPVGTVIGAYGLWVLLSKDTEQLFARPATPTY